MEISNKNTFAICKEVLRINMLFNNYSLVQSFRHGIYISNSEDEDDVSLEPCMEGGRASMTCPQGVGNEFVYFNMTAITDIRIGIFLVCLKLRF